MVPMERDRQHADVAWPLVPGPWRWLSPRTLSPPPRERLLTKVVFSRVIITNYVRVNSRFISHADAAKLNRRAVEVAPVASLKVDSGRYLKVSTPNSKRRSLKS